MSIIQVLAFNFFPACSAQLPNRGATLTNASLDRLSGTRRAVPTGPLYPCHFPRAQGRRGPGEGWRKAST